jgi:peptide-methionine (S)-S-oxide reductase
MQRNDGLEVATLGGGCFWCTEAVFDDLKGVTDVVSGYAGGQTLNPTYRDICNGDTGHAEVIQVTFDPQQISYRDLLRVFFATHDPTTLNRQGADVGTQYRSVIFTHSPEQAEAAREVIAELTDADVFGSPIVTEVTELTGPFYPAEAYHQEYFANNPNQPYCSAVVAPKVAKFRKQFLDQLKR